MSRKTALHDVHRQMGGRLVEYAGWELPLHYGSQIEEHHAVRTSAGMFDVSHMGVLDLSGARCTDFVRFLLANDVGRLHAPGQALYSCLLNERGGVLDDVIAYRMAEDRYRIIGNAATRRKDLDWIGARAIPFGVRVLPRDEFAILAVQGPAARSKLFDEGSVSRETLDGLEAFQCGEQGAWQISRTGYTGEDGYELILPGQDAVRLWQSLHALGVKPCGLGARDSLRLEAGFRLYGADMDEAVTPLECGLAWTVAWKPEEREFIGRVALEEQRSRPGLSCFSGLLLLSDGVLRAHQRVVVTDVGEGVTTSGGYAPTLGRSIALARMPPGHYDTCLVEIRGRWKPCRVVRPRFVSHGHVLVPLEYPTHITLA